jgi:hypothetical protein
MVLYELVRVHQKVMRRSKVIGEKRRGEIRPLRFRVLNMQFCRYCCSLQLYTDCSVAGS